MFVKAMKSFIKDESGLEATEYAIMLALAVALAFVGARALYTAVNTKFSTVGTQVGNGTVGQ